MSIFKGGESKRKSQSTAESPKYVTIKLAGLFSVERRINELLNAGYTVERVGLPCEDFATFVKPDDNDN